MKIFNGTIYTRCILLYGKKLNRPICTDMEDVHEFHYILKEQTIYKIAYGERRSPDGITTGYLDLFTPNTMLSASNIKQELPADICVILRKNITKEINQYMARVHKLNTILKKIK